MKTPKVQPWAVLKSEYLYREPWFTVRCDTVQLPNGRTIPNYYVLEYPDWVAILAVTKNNEFVLINQYRHGLGLSSYELSAGVIDKEDPSPLFAAQRELLEETGYGNGTWAEYMVTSANPGTHSNTTYCFLATDVELISPQNLDDTEDISVHIFSLDKVKKMLIDNEIKQSMHVAPLWKYIAENHLIY